MKQKLLDILKKYRNGIIAIVLVVVALAFFWSYVISDTYMPIEHISSVSDGGFKVTSGEIRTIAVKSADGYDRDTEDLMITIKDDNGNTVWSYDASGMIGNTDSDEGEVFIAQGEKYDLLFESEAGEGVILSPGKYYIGTNKDEGDFQPFIFKLHEYRSSYGKMYLVISIEILIAVILTVIILYGRRRFAFHTIFLILAIAFGIIVNTIFPPLAVPDEKVHFREAYEAASSLYDKLPFNRVPTSDYNGRLLVRATDYDSIMYLHDMASVAGWYEGIWDKADYRYVPVDFDSTVTTRTVYVYVPASIGINIARGLRLNGRWLLYMGRFVSFALCVFIIYMSIRILPGKKELMTMLALLPQCIYLFMSYSYDGINLALCFLVVSLVYSICENKKGKKYVKLIILCLTLLLMIPIKMAYFPYLLLLLLLIDHDWIKNILSNNKARIILLIMAAAAVAVLIPLFLSGWNNILGMIGYSSEASEIAPGSRITVSYVLSDIPGAIKLYYNTMWYNSKHYLPQMFGAVAGGLRDGTHTYRMPVILVIFETIVILISMTEEEKQSNGMIKKIIVWMTGIMCILMVYTGLLFGDTKVGNWYISGIQGRYFLPVLFLLPLGIDITAIKIDEDKKRKIAIAGCSITFLLFFFLAFYYYATNYFSELI